MRGAGPWRLGGAGMQGCGGAGRRLRAARRPLRAASSCGAQFRFRRRLRGAAPPRPVRTPPPGRGQRVCARLRALRPPGPRGRASPGAEPLAFSGCSSGAVWLPNERRPWVSPQPLSGERHPRPCNRAARSAGARVLGRPAAGVPRPDGHLRRDGLEGHLAAAGRPEEEGVQRRARPPALDPPPTRPRPRPPRRLPSVVAVGGMGFESGAVLKLGRGKGEVGSSAGGSGAWGLGSHFCPEALVRARSDRTLRGGFQCPAVTFRAVGGQSLAEEGETRVAASVGSH